VAMHRARAVTPQARVAMRQARAVTRQARTVAEFTH
jgi:hypothetical protein